jgi:hypothetical protein
MWIASRPWPIEIAHVFALSRGLPIAASLKEDFAWASLETSAVHGRKKRRGRGGKDTAAPSRPPRHRYRGDNEIQYSHSPAAACSSSSTSAATGQGTRHSPAKVTPCAGAIPSARDDIDLRFDQLDRNFRKLLRRGWPAASREQQVLALEEAGPAQLFEERDPMEPCTWKVDQSADAIGSPRLLRRGGQSFDRRCRHAACPVPKSHCPPQARDAHVSDAQVVRHAVVPPCA